MKYFIHNGLCSFVSEFAFSCFLSLAGDPTDMCLVFRCSAVMQPVQMPSRAFPMSKIVGQDMVKLALLLAAGEWNILTPIDLFLSLCLSGLHWHLSGLSELSLEQRLLILLAGESFPFSLCCRRAIFPQFLLLLAFFCTMYEHIVEQLPQAQHIRQHKPQSTYQGTCRSEGDSASKQTELARANVSSSVYCPAYKNMQQLTQRCCDARRVSL